MPWTTPTDRATGYVVTATDWNIVEDNLTYLYGDTAWTNVITFTNSWHDRFCAPLHPRSGTGRLSYEERYQVGTANTAAFTLPAGYRPSQAQQFTCALNSSSTPLNVVVNTTGTVVPLTSQTVWLANISFPVV